jgi:histidine decarboxylase
MDSKKYEIKVLDFFHKLYNFKIYSPDKLRKKDPWGYITSGGTEGNLMGLFMAKNKYPKGVIYSTKNGHYSIVKNIKILNTDYKIIGSHRNGEMNYEKLRAELLKEKETPIINLTIGTTFEGAIDSVDKVLLILDETLHREFYIHCDGALLGGFLPFLKGRHELDFHKRIDSISVSAHKFFGVPFPSGVFLSKEKPNGKIINYIASHDTTISGSRCGQSAIFLCALIEQKGVEVFREEALNCVENAEYLRDCLQKINYNPQLNKNSNIVTFTKPSKFLINKWQLSTMRDRAHVILMQHVTRETINRFIEDISSELK